MPHAFFSYVHADWDKVRHIYDHLTLNGIPAWIDRDKIDPGARWEDAIRRAIRSGDVFICFFPRTSSKKAVAS